jgi:hypothetical protein
MADDDDYDHDYIPLTTQFEMMLQVSKVCHWNNTLASSLKSEVPTTPVYSEMLIDTTVYRTKKQVYRIKKKKKKSSEPVSGSALVRCHVSPPMAYTEIIMW